MSKQDAQAKTPPGHTAGGYTPDLLAKAPGGLIHVTEELIEHSVRAASGNCMIAEAVKARFPWASRVSVDLQTIRFTDVEKGERYTYLTPRESQIALVMFDQGIKVEPFKLRLRGGAVTTSGRTLRGKAKVVHKPNSHQEKPVRVGGPTPPIGGLAHPAPKKRRGGSSQPTAAGAARKFGLRSLDRIPQLRES